VILVPDAPPLDVAPSSLHAWREFGSWKHPFACEPAHSWSVGGYVHNQADTTVRAETTTKPPPCTVKVADGDTSRGLANLGQSLHQRFSKARVAADPRVRPRCARQTGSRGWSVAAFEKQTGGGDQGRKAGPAEEGERSFIVSCPDARLRP
jgi:hypothetical protein